MSNHEPLLFITYQGQALAIRMSGTRALVQGGVMAARSRSCKLSRSNPAASWTAIR